MALAELIFIEGVRMGRVGRVIRMASSQGVRERERGCIRQQNPGSRQESSFFSFFSSDAIQYFLMLHNARATEHMKTSDKK
jgi:hypothetical protein